MDINDIFIACADKWAKDVSRFAQNVTELRAKRN